MLLETTGYKFHVGFLVENSWSVAKYQSDLKQLCNSCNYPGAIY